MTSNSEYIDFLVDNQPQRLKRDSYADRKGNTIFLCNIRRTWYDILMEDVACNEKEVVLIVDDQEVIGELIGALIEDRGCAYVSFSDPLKALSYYEANPTQITIMIVDLTMPSLSGAGLVRKVLETNPALPIVLLINYSGEYVPEDVSHSVCRVIEKPFTKSELMDALGAALRKARKGSL